MRNRELIISLPNSDLELYSLILSLYLDTVIVSLTNVDDNFTMISIMMDKSK
jgi:hypothetical protein